MIDGKKIVFLGFVTIIALLGAYVLSGALVLLMNKVGFWRFFQLWHLNFIIESVSNGYPKTWQSVGISFFLSFFGVSLLSLFLFFKNKESLFGEARFANQREIKKMGLFGDADNYVKRGIIIGKYGKRFLKYGGAQFVALGAPTRSGKGVGIVIPNLLHWEESAVVQDIKQECFDFTSKYRQEKLGNKIYLFNPFSTRTHRYNPFTYIDMEDDEKADSQLMDLATIIYPLGKDDTSKFFSQQAQNLFIGLCYLYKDLTMSERGKLFLETYELEAEFNFYGILQLSKGFEVIDPDSKEKLAVGFEPTYALLDELGILSKTTKRRIGTYIQIDSANTKSGVMSSFNAPLSSFEGDTLRLATETSDFDLRKLRKEKMTIYLGITPDQLENAKFLLNIFWSQLISLNTKELPEQNPEIKYVCLLLMDEFTAPGRIVIYQTSISFIAGYWLRSLMIYQAKSQLRDEPPLGYGQQGAKTLLTNHACQIYYAPKEQEDADELSKMLGNKTVKQISKSANKGANGGGSESTSETHRALMLPQELKEMPFERELVMIDSSKPILCDKAIYFKDKFFMNRFKEVSPSLADIKGIPSEKQLKTAVQNGECNVPIPIQKFELKGA